MQQRRLTAQHRPIVIRRRALPLPFDPQWHGPAERWSKSWVRRNFWRVRVSLLSQADALSECAIIFSRCRRRYAGIVDNMRWFMALYRRAVVNAFCRFATLDKRERVTTEQMTPHWDAVEYNGAPLLIHLHQNPELLRLLNLLLQAPDNLVNGIFARPLRHPVATANARLRAIVGITDPSRNLIAEFRSILP